MNFIKNACLGVLIFLNASTLNAQNSLQDSLNAEIKYLEKYRTNFAQLDYYKVQNIPMETHGNKPNVVFMGNSITEMWHNLDSAYFKKNNFICRGVSGQTSSQMLLRFRQDVIELKPKAVTLLCGINDIAENTGPISLHEIQNNIATMAELASLHKIDVVLCSILPTNHIFWNPDINPVEKIIEMNKWIKSFAKAHNYHYVDYYSQLVGDNAGLIKSLTTDGVHVNAEAYKKMEILLAPFLRKYL